MHTLSILSTTLNTGVKEINSSQDNGAEKEVKSHSTLVVEPVYMVLESISPYSIPTYANQENGYVSGDQYFPVGDQTKTYRLMCIGCTGLL